MALLRCSYASERSHPDKIEAWISELSRYREIHKDNPEQLKSIEILLNRANGWLHRRQALGTLVD